MKKDVMAATATVVAIVIMIVAIVAMCAVPAQADERAAAEARLRARFAEYPCRDALYYARERNWNMLHSLSFRPITDEVVDLSMIVNASPAPWQRSSEPPRPVWEMRLNLTDSSHDMARYETMDGASSCTARWVALVALGQAYYDWVVESIDVAGVAQIKRTIPGSAAAVK